MAPEHVLAGLATAVAGVSTVVAWAFATGKFAAGVVTRDELDRKADCDDVQQLHARVTGEHNERKRLVEEMNRALGVLQIAQAREAEKLAALEREVTRLHARVDVFPRGGAGV